MYLTADSWWSVFLVQDLDSWAALLKFWINSDPKVENQWAFFRADTEPLSKNFHTAMSFMWWQ